MKWVYSVDENLPVGRLSIVEFSFEMIGEKWMMETVLKIYGITV